MERRRTERYEINVSANIVFNNNTYKGVIENFSNGGLGVRCALNENLKSITTGSRIDVEFNVSYQNKVNFQCETRWKREYNDQEHGAILKVGLEYIEMKD